MQERKTSEAGERMPIPSDLEEYISIYAGSVPNSLRFVCSPLETPPATGQLSMQTKSEPTVADSKPTSITLLGNAYPVSNWGEVFLKTCETLLLHRPYHMAVMDRDTTLNTAERTVFDYLESGIKGNGKRLSNGLWVETKLDSYQALDIGRRLLEKCGFSPDDIQVEFLEA